MAINPAAMIKIASAINTFKQNHPKFITFAEYVFRSGIPVDSVIEITVTKPGEDSVTTNFKVQQSDLDLFETLKSMNTMN